MKQCSALQRRIHLDILLPSNSRAGTDWIVCFAFVLIPGLLASLFLDCSCFRLLHTVGGSRRSYIDILGVRMWSVFEIKVQKNGLHRRI